MAEYVLKPQDVWGGRARIHLPLASKLLLCHWAGAPWSDKNEDAHLSALQTEVLARSERLKVIHGGSGLGKSVIGGAELVCDSVIPNNKAAVVAGLYKHVGHEFEYLVKGLKSLFKNRLAAFERLSYKNTQNYHEFSMISRWGSSCIGMSVEKDEGAALLGSEFDHVVIGEGSHVSPAVLSKRIWRALDRRLMSKDGPKFETGKCSIYTTPKGFGGCSASEHDRIRRVTKGKMDALEYGKVPYERTAWIREASVLENPDYSHAAFQAAEERAQKSDKDRAEFEETYLGKMTYASGRVYQEYSEHVHRVPMPSAEHIRQMRLAVGIDTGAYFGMILAGIDRKSHIWLLSEVYTQKASIEDSCREVRDELMRVLGPVFRADEWDLIRDRIDCWYPDPASQHKIDISELLDVVVAHPSRDQGAFDLIPTIDHVRSLWMHNRLWLVDELEITEDQLRKYVWKMMKSPNGSGTSPAVKEPRKEYDHLLDAMRCVVVPLSQEGPPTEPPKPVTFREAWALQQKQRVFGPLREDLERAERFQRSRM